MLSKPSRKKILFVLRQAPYGHSLAREAFDAILATSAYDQQLSVVFIDDGVFQLMTSQQAEVIEEKSIGKILSAFPLYDIQSLFVCYPSMQQRGIDANDIPSIIKPLNRTELKMLFSQQDHLLSF